MKVKALHDRLRVTPIEDEARNKGAIVIPGSVKEKPTEGKVIGVGSGRVMNDGRKVPLEVKVGDRVLLGSYPGTEVKVDDKEHVIVREDVVLGIVL